MQNKNINKPPPPVIVQNITNFPELINKFAEANIKTDSYQCKSLNSNNIKINAKNPEAYRDITKCLNEINMGWHSYEDKQARDIRVMIKNLHSSIDPIDIIADLNQQGLKAKNAVNKRKWLSAKEKKERKNKGLPEIIPLDMFIVSFDNDTDIKKISEIKIIMATRVIVEPLKIDKTIPQCKRCQEYGHTQNFCNKVPRCVKCSKKHHTKDCTKKAEDLPKCVHCGEAHPANYRGCTVFKAIKDLRNKKSVSHKEMQTKRAAQGTTDNANESKPPNSNATTSPPVASQSYAQACTKSKAIETKSIETILLQIVQRLDKLEYIIEHG